MSEKEKIYDEICRLLTDYEQANSKNKVLRADFYNLLVKIQNNWESVLTAQE